MRAATSPGRRQQQTSAYTSGYHSSPTTTPQFAGLPSVEVLRSLVFDGSVALCVGLAGDELPAGSDRFIENMYIQAPRISYLPLLITEIRKNLLDLVLDEKESVALDENDFWFDCQGEPLKWHWPLGLIHDFLIANNVLASSDSELTRPSYRSYFPEASTSSSSRQPPTSPIRITLHLRDPPQDKLLMSPSIDSCRTNFMNQLKEADFVRWGSVRRVTSLRKADQDALWDGVVNRDFQRFWQVASKLVPTPSITPNTASTSPVLTTTSTLDAGLKAPSANAMRSVPMRVYLPHGGPVIQDVVPTIVVGTTPGVSHPQTLQSALSTLLPALFPSSPQSGSMGMTSSFITHQKPIVKRVIVQGIPLPLDAELSWCAACLVYPDGWLGVVLGF